MFISIAVIRDLLLPGLLKSKPGGANRGNRR